jgi:hypothetical protein
MPTITNNFKLLPILMLITCTCLLFVVGCTRYTRNVNTLYQPSATVSGGSGQVYIVIPESRQTHSSEIKWVLGKVKDDDNNIIDEVSSPRSPAEIIQDAFSLEFRRAGYSVITATKQPAGNQLVLDLTRTDIVLDQVSDLADLNAKCRVVIGMDVYKNGQQIKRLQYESSSSKIDIKDRDMLARIVLEDALKSVMREAMPELHNLFRQ